MSDYIEQGEVKQLIVQRTDGSTWTAEIGLDGKVRLLQKLHDPSVGVAEEEKDEQDQQVEQQTQPEQADAGNQGEQDDQAEGEGQESQPEEAWGEAKPADEQYSDSDIDKYLEGMAHRGSTGNYEKSEPPRKKLDAEYHKRLKDPAFLARLNSIMLDNKYARRLRGRTRGKLDMSRLFKVPTHSRSVFTQKQERKGKQYNIVLVVDQSGSMSGRKEEVAAEAVLFLAKQFENLNLNIGVIGYGSHVKVHKELNTKKFNYDELYTELTTSMGGTDDYPALRRAYHMFRTAPEGQNILIHVSDGSPGIYYNDSVFYGVNGKRERLKGFVMPTSRYEDKGYVDYNQKEHLHHLVRSHPEVTAFGIGIQQGGWQIPDHVVIHNVSELKPKILGILRKNIRRG